MPDLTEEAPRPRPGRLLQQEALANTMPNGRTTPNRRAPAASDRDARRAREVAARRQRRKQPQRSGNRRWLYVAALVLVAGGVVAAAGRDSTPEATETVEASPSLHTGPPPWPPVYDGLAERVAKLGFPPSGDESYHAHALVSIFDGGQPVPVPVNIGIDPASPAGHSSLHTHTADGIIHMEADDPYPYKLSDLFAVWGVDFGADRLGGLRAEGTEVLRVFVNGEPAADPLAVEMNDGDNIAIGVGPPGSFPALPPDDALRNL